MTHTLTETDLLSVQAVLSHWFDGDQQVNYKTKWFPEGSTGLQAIADHEINTKFGSLFSEALDRKLHHWQCETKSCMALIIVLDQFSRHICRLHGKELMQDKQKLADELALDIAQNLHSSDEKTLGLSIPEYVFSLMPLRHTATVDHLSHVLECLLKKERVEEKSMELLNRFRKQTTRRLQHLQDREKLEATADILEREAFLADETDIMSHPLVRTTEAFLIKHLQLSSAGMSSTKNTVSSGKGGKNKREDRKAGEKQDGKNSTTSVDNSDGSAVKAVEPNIVLFISLSGGVDSMVISKILRLLQLHRPQLRIKSIQAMHIDYGNRPESAEEAAFVMQWSHGDDKDSAMLGGLHCQVRRVDEVTRGVTNRDEYEKVARDIRYSFYKQCMAEASATGNSDSSGEDKGDTNSDNHNKVVLSGVIFGHHQGDVQENVISNVMRGSGPLQLSGMSDASITNGVPVWRPLLDHNKDEIYDFAHRYGVPYFKDSTPSWSTRGKLRNQLVPLLLDMYGSGCLHNLAALARESDLTRDLVQTNLYEPFLSSVSRHPCGLSVNVLPYRQQPQCFWREALRQLMHSMNMSMVRDSAVGNFVERLQKPSARLLAGWLELRKGVHSFLTESGELVILREGVLRKHLSLCVSSTTNNQKRQQMLSQAKKLPALTAISAAVSDAEKAKTALGDAYTGLMEVKLDLRTSLFTVDADKLVALNQREFGTSRVDSAATVATAAGEVLVVGPWRIHAQVLYADQTTDPAIGCKALSSLAAVLPGTFVYDLPLPQGTTIDSVHLSFHFQLEQLRSHSEELTLYHDLCDQLQRGLSITTSDSASATPTTTTASSPTLPSYEEVQAMCREVVAPADLSLMVDRLRHGLPLLVLRNRKIENDVSRDGVETGLVGVPSAVRLLFAYL
eukprot:gene13521-15563_t